MKQTKLFDDLTTNDKLYTTNQKAHGLFLI